PRGLTAGELTAGAMVTSGAITNRLDRLVAKGLVTREIDPANRRSGRVALTAAGSQRADEALRAHLANEERLLAPLDAED
ncbi:MarR family transcriptional regulator, partial [Salmonella enterica]|nr:MarR family transcriptional regulator [Salmonella enterica]